MKHIALFLFFSVGIQLQSQSQSFKIQNNIKRVVFLGNSITYAGKYIEYIETYLSVRHPEKRLEFINVGLPSETVSGLSEKNHANGKFPRPDLHHRLKRILSKTKPDLVIACYGMNDGIYMPYDDKRFKKYKKGINWLHAEVKKINAEIIHVTPPIYDERKGEAYANVLDIYSDWLIARRYTSDWNVIDIHWPMKRHLENQRLITPNFLFAKDGIHPNASGHFLMAKHILLYLGETELSKASDIKSAVRSHKKGTDILKLIEKRQKMMKDAWLTHIGHKRPKMNIGLPMAEALRNSDEIENQILDLLKQE